MMLRPALLLVLVAAAFSAPARAQSLDELARIAIDIGDERALSAALDRGANAKAIVNDAPLLTQAAATGQFGMVRALVGKGANLNEKQAKPEMIPLLAAALKGQFEIIQPMLSSGADPKVENNRIVTILLNAGRFDIVQSAFGAGVGINDADERGRPIARAVLDQHSKLQELLLSSVCQPEASWRNAEFLYERSTKLLAYMITDGLDLTQKSASDGDGTILHDAAQRGAWRVVEMLMARKANAFATNKGGQSPLVLALAYEPSAPAACPEARNDLSRQFRVKQSEQRRPIISALLSAMIDGGRK